MKMNRPPVNSLNLDFLTDFTITLEKLENEKSCIGLILATVGTVWDIIFDQPDFP